MISIANDPFVNYYTLWSLCENFIPNDPYVKYLYLMIPIYKFYS